MADGGRRGRDAMQDWALFAMYLNEGTWRCVEDQDRRDHEVLDRLVCNLHALGLRHPSEPCQAAMTALLLLRKHGASVATVSQNQSPMQLRSLYLTVKSFVGTKLNKMKVGQPAVAAAEYLAELPANPADLPQSLQNKWFPLTTPYIEPMDIVNLARTIPLRSDHRLLREATSLQGSGGLVVHDPWAKIGMMLLGTVSGLGGAPYMAMPGMPGVQQNPAQPVQLAICDEPKTGLPALLNRAQSSCNVGGPTTPSPVLAMANPSAQVNATQVAGDTAQDPQTCPAQQQQAIAEQKAQPAAPMASDMIEAPHAPKHVPFKDSVEAFVKAKQNGQKESSPLKKQQKKTPVSKPPAGSVSKKPVGKKTNQSMKVAKEKAKVTRGKKASMSAAKKLLLAKIPAKVKNMFRNGCAKCRYAHFCTPSCWKARGWK